MTYFVSKGTSMAYYLQVAEVQMKATPTVYLGFGEALQTTMDRYRAHDTCACG